MLIGCGPLGTADLRPLSSLTPLALQLSDCAPYSLRTVSGEKCHTKSTGSRFKASTESWATTHPTISHSASLFYCLSQADFFPLFCQ